MTKWLWGAVGAFVVAFGVSGFFIVRLLGVIPGAPARVDRGPVQLDGVGLTIFSTTRNAGQTCTAKDASGAEIALKEPSRSEKWDRGSAVYYVVAHSVHKVPAQTVEVSCTNQDVKYFVGRRHTAEVFAVPALSAVASFTFFVAVGALLIVVDQRHRRRATRPVQ
ncbi:hypothetical protein EV646_11778 [Kribbella antiqua]|uniref:Uncharacterized protein n=1 Tax=Kribbella antiqua TaxID=2512217 RepID=A0A4R2I8S4_9ACTN|nr:hypothetical protein [Kribbella antiqua]TCO40537.1 hypothetical protein EV646_11778 [Kribbella antiqua]